MTDSTSISPSDLHAQASPTPAKRSFRAQMHLAREAAIVQAVNRLLAEKGFEGMTVDEVAAEVGIAKASLYKHFDSKEALAAAAMARLMCEACDFLQAIPAAEAPLAKLKRVARWTMGLQLAGQMPSLPSENSSLRSALASHSGYMDGLLQVSEQLGEWIEAAQADGSLNPQLPAIVVLYTLYARACDPVLGFLKGAGLFETEAIIDMVLSSCFDGLRARTDSAPS